MQVAKLPRSDLWAAATTIAVGAFGAWEALSYPLGTAGQIGPAIFPLGLSLLLIVAGVAIFVEGALVTAEEDEQPAANRLTTILAILGGPLAFALLLERFGLVPAVIACVLISGAADRSVSALRTVLLAIGLSVGCWLVFIVFLRLPVQPVTW